MKNNMKRIWAMALAVMMIFSMAPGALASEYVSGSMSVGDRVKITPAPTSNPTPAPQEPEESEQPGAVETAAPEATVSPEVSDQPQEQTTVSPEVSAEPTPEPRKAVVYKKGEDQVAIIREGPSSDTERVGKAHSGDAVLVFGEQDGWLQVEVNGVSGWMHSSLVSFDVAVDPVETEVPAETVDPAETEAPAETVDPAETEAPAETVEPVETVEPAETVDPVVTETPEASVEPEVTPLPQVEQNAPAAEPRPALVYKKGQNDVAFVREGPSIDYDRVGKVKDGTPVTVLAEENGWYQVDVNGLVGWMSSTMITFDLGDAQPAETPVPTPAPTVTPELTVSPEPTDGLEEAAQFMTDENGELILDENGNPIPVAADEPEATPEPMITYERDAEGQLVLDESGNPVAIVPEGMAAPAAYMRDASGALVFDVNGDPIPVEPAAEEPAAEPERLVLPLLTESESELGLTMYAQADEASEALAVIPAGQMVAVLEIGETWSLVRYEEAEGYVLTAKIALYNQEVAPEEETIVRSISVTSSLEGAGVVEEGTECVLTATLTGFENDSYTMQWQYTPDMGETIVNVEGAVGDTYSFPITMENAGYLWRLSVTILDAPQEDE